MTNTAPKRILVVEDNPAAEMELGEHETIQSYYVDAVLQRERDDAME
jgi:hypothetical protein